MFQVGIPIASGERRHCDPFMETTEVGVGTEISTTAERRASPLAGLSALPIASYPGASLVGARVRELVTDSRTQSLAILALDFLLTALMFRGV